MAGSEELFKAIKTEDVDAVKRVLGTSPELASQRHSSGLSPILAALYSGNIRVAEVVLAANPDLDTYDAAALGRTDLVTRALEEDASIAQGCTKDGYTLLHIAAFFGHVETVGVLLKTGGVQVDARSRNDLQVTPLLSACSTGSFDVATRLLASGADVTAKQQGAVSALHLAAKVGDARLVRLLRQFGADLNAKNADGQTPADVAAGPEAASALAS